MEYEVLSYLHRMGLPVPKPYHQESREGVIGTEFFIMEYVDVSRALLHEMCECEHRELNQLTYYIHLLLCKSSFGVQGIVLEDHSLPDLQPAQRRTVYLSMMETLARLHHLPMGDLELLLDPEKAYNDNGTFWNWQVCVHCMHMLLFTCCGYLYVCTCLCVCTLHVHCAHVVCIWYLLCVLVSVGMVYGVCGCGCVCAVGI